MKRPALPLMLLILASIFLLFLLNLLLGSVHIPFGKIWELLWGTGAASNPDTMSNQEVIWSNILWKSRVPQALTALVAGAGLSVSGLQMQTVFRNPLAGPSVLGISSGCEPGSGLCGTAVRCYGRCGTEPFGVYGRGGVVRGCHYRGIVGAWR